MAGPRAVAIVLSDGERGELERRVRRRKIAHADAMRAEIVLLAADGLNNCAIAEESGSSRMTVMTWRKRFASRRLDGLDDFLVPARHRLLRPDACCQAVEPGPPGPSAACAAASRAIGTRNGEHDT